MIAPESLIQRALERAGVELSDDVADAVMHALGEFGYVVCCCTAPVDVDLDCPAHGLATRQNADFAESSRVTSQPQEKP